MEFYYEKLYRPGLVLQVPNALSRQEEAETGFNYAFQIDKRDRIFRPFSEAYSFLFSNAT